MHQEGLHDNCGLLAGKQAGGLLGWLTVMHQADLGPDWVVSSAWIVLLLSRRGTPTAHGICLSSSTPRQASTRPEGSMPPQLERAST